MPVHEAMYHRGTERRMAFPCSLWIYCNFVRAIDEPEFFLQMKKGFSSFTGNLFSDVLLNLKKGFVFLQMLVTAWLN
jgi:hypothetical protein